MGLTTTSNFGNVIDITHKPQRTQADNVRAAGREFGANNNEVNAPVASVNLQAVSLESAIKYYESHATGELSVLYKNTAKWLRDLLAIDRYKIAEAKKALSEGSNETNTTESEAKEET